MLTRRPALEATRLRVFRTALGVCCPASRGRVFESFEVTDGRISAVTTYCNGGWDDELRARHAAEAPMIRP